MKLFLFFIAIFHAFDICASQYDNSQYSQYQQQRQPSYNYNYNRVQPNQLYGRVVTRRTDQRVRQKPNYGRVDPIDYRRIMDRGNTQQVIVYPKQNVQVMYPKYQQKHYNPYYQKKVVRRPYVQTVQQPVQTGYKPKWPKLRGRCQKVPNIKLNGKNPVREECNRGHAVLVFLMKRRCDFCYHQLKMLNKLAKHYKEAGKPLSVIAINHKRGPLAPAVVRQFPHVKIYDEPNSEDYFGKLGGAWRQVILYDVCCRKQYLYGYPFSWMGYTFVRHAIFNTLYYDQVICGVCKAPTRAPQNTTLPTEPSP